MDSTTGAALSSDDAVEFVRFCYRRRRVGWPDLYDEMCAVASRGLYRGWGTDELSREGIGFSLFEMPALAALVARVVTEEHARRAAPPTPGGRHAADARRPGPVDSEGGSSMAAGLAGAPAGA